MRIPGIGRLFRLLRGWAQMRQGYVSLILVGRDPTYLSAPEIEGVTSPLTAWCTPMWLGPLTPPKAVELLRKLGRRVGLEIGRASAELAQRWTGGHPLLHRQFGSALRSVTRIQDLTWGASTDRVAEQAPSRFMEREAVLDVMREVVALLRKRDPVALDVLVDLARGEGWEQALAERGGPDGETGRALRNFGLVSSEYVVAEGLAWYLVRASLPQLLRKIARDGAQPVPLHRFGRDFHSKNALLEEQVFAIAVMLGARSVDGWAEDYERECLTGCTLSESSTPPDLVGRWRVETSSPAGRPWRTTHFLVQIPKRA